MSGIESCGPVTALTLGLPSTTAVMHPRGRLAKERFYTNTKVGKRLRQHFIEDIDSITMLAVIREQETGIPAGPFTNEINVIGLEQSTEHPPLEVMEHIARTRDELTHHRSRILFVCVNGSMTKFAVFRNANVAEGLMEGSVHMGEPVECESALIRLSGTNLDTVWESLCAETILSSSDPTRVDRRIVSRTRIMRLIKEIDQLERRHARTVQIGQRNRLWDDLQAKRHELRTGTTRRNTVSDIEKIHGITPDLTRENVDRLLALFPDVATEITDPKTGRTERAVDFDALKERLSDVAEGNRERYQFTWPGKREAKRLAREPIAKTLRPVKERSKDWDTTKNLYIEGDNLDALKLLRENYAGKVKLIYIDPPYNTGHDFVYDDDFSQTQDEFSSESGEYNEDGGRLVANTESNGRFHSDWCSMIYPRLLLARDLLTSDGAIFISIDDNEYLNMRALCNEIFGAANFVASIVWQKTLTRRNDAQQISTAHDYVLVFAKQLSSLKIQHEPVGEKQRATYTNRDNDPRGDWLAVPFHAPNIRPNLTYPIVLPSGREVIPPKGRCWSTSKDNFDALVADGRIWFGKDGDGMPQRKKYWGEREQDEGVVPWTWWSYEFAGENREATKELKALFEGATIFPRLSR